MIYISIRSNEYQGVTETGLLALRQIERKFFSSPKPSHTAMTFEPAQNQLAFVLPVSFRKAEVIFQKRFDHSEEVHLVVQPNQRPRQVVSTQQLSSGLWHVILDWWDGKRHYWAEKDIVIH